MSMATSFQYQQTKNGDDIRATLAAANEYIFPKKNLELKGRRMPSYTVGILK